MRWAWWYFLGLTLLVVFPWFIQPGFLFLLDFVWPPELTMLSTWWATPSLSTVPYEWFWWGLSFLVPTAVLQKLVFSLPFFIAGLAMFHLICWFLHRWQIRLVLVPALAAGTFYALNSFVITRVFMGHFYLLLAYALTPWAVLLFLQFLDDQRWQRGLAAALLFLAVVITNSHQFFLLPVFLVFLLRRRHLQQTSWLGWVVFLLPLVIFVAASWLVSHQAITDQLDSRGPWARALQAPYSGHLALDTLLLTANWKPMTTFLLPHEQLTSFGSVMLWLFVIMGWGVWHWRTKTRVLLWGSVGATLVATGLALGVAHPLTAPVASWLFRHLPFWIGMRDSAKWLAVVALSESILLGAGLSVLPRKVTLGTLGLVIFLSTPAWRGFSGQVMPNIYPTSWFEARTVVEQAGHEQRVLFLPWHHYLPFSFSDDRTIDNPARRFFNTVEVITGDNSEVGGIGGQPFIYSESKRPLSKKIESDLATAHERTDFGHQLAAEHIRFVILARDTSDSERYVWLGKQRDLELIFERDELFIWKNKAF